MTLFHSRPGRPDHNTRTPRSTSWSLRRRITSRLKPMRKRTSSGERFQFSVENAYADRYGMPSSIAPSITSNSEASPASWPFVRGRPRDLAHRPLPSMTIATCRGTNSRGIAGGVTPDGCGAGGRNMRPRVVAPGGGNVRRLCRLGALHVPQRADPVLQVPLQVGGDQAAALDPVARLGRVGGRPVAAE